MKKQNCLKKMIFKGRKSRAQVFILATLIIVVYSVSMIAVVTELSINRTKIDQVDVAHVVNEYLTEMKYQLEMQLFNYVKNSAVTPNTVIINLESFISTFSFYASSKGVDANVNLRSNEYIISARKTGSTPVAISGIYNHTMFISINSSILFQSSNSGSKISGIFINYFGINVVSNSADTLITLTEKDFFGHTLHPLPGAKFSVPVSTVTDNNDGSYTGTFSGAGGIDFTLPSGIEFIS